MWVYVFQKWRLWLQCWTGPIDEKPLEGSHEHISFWEREREAVEQWRERKIGMERMRETQIFTDRKRSICVYIYIYRARDGDRCIEGVRISTKSKWTAEVQRRG